MTGPDEDIRMGRGPRRPPPPPGDEVVLRVEGIGTLRHRVVEPDPFVELPPARPGRVARAGR